MPLELIVFVGIQGAGKSTYYRAHLAATHVHVSKDLMPNARNRDAKQTEMITQALAAGRSVVVDNTSPTPIVRAPLIALGKALGARVVAYSFETPVKEAAARNRLREGKARVPDSAVFITARKLVPPSLEEGFDEVRVIAPVPETA
ncbi:MAG TPA: ATP-binding protein [Thermoanaerobaculia bacterium]|jgi:predicted kinase|nr:ATP-binding protein [Thermoanaerobaculia bacterium]